MSVKLGQTLADPILDLCKIIYRQNGEIKPSQFLDLQLLVGAYKKIHGGRLNCESIMSKYIDNKKVVIKMPIDVKDKLEARKYDQIDKNGDFAKLIAKCQNSIRCEDFTTLKVPKETMESLQYLSISKSQINQIIDEMIPKMLCRKKDALLSKEIFVSKKDFICASSIPSLKENYLIVGNKTLNIHTALLLANGLGQLEQSYVVNKRPFNERINANTSLLNKVVPMYFELITIDNMTDTTSKARLLNEFLNRSKKAAMKLGGFNSLTKNSIDDIQTLYGSIISTELHERGNSGVDDIFTIIDKLGQTTDQDIMASIGIDNSTLRGQAAFERTNKRNKSQIKKLLK